MPNDAKERALQRRTWRLARQFKDHTDALFEADKEFKILANKFMELMQERVQEWLPRLREGKKGESDPEIQNVIDESVRTIFQLSQRFPEMMKDVDEKLRSLDIAANRDDELFTAMLKMLVDNMKARLKQAELEVKQFANLIERFKTRARPN